MLFATGVRYNTGLSAVSLNIGGQDAQVTYAGLVPGFIGLDQINALIPRSLLGRGELEVALTVDGKPANKVRINIR